MKKLFFAFVLLCCVSCGVFNRYTRPETGVTYADSVQAAPWKEMYRDALLQDLVDTALANATDYRVAQLKSEEAAAMLRRSRLQFFPSLGASASADLRSGDVNAGLNASCQLDIFGKMRASSLAADAAYKGSGAYVQAVKASIVAAVASSYYTLVVLDSQLDVSERTLENWDKTISVLESLKAAGKTNDIAVLQAQAKKMKLQSSTVELRRSITEAENALCLLMGVTRRQIPRGSLQDAQDAFAGGLPAGVPVVAVASRPDVRQAEMVLAEAFYTTAGARAAFYPDVTLSGSGSWLTSGSDLIWSALASLAAPLFSRGEKTAALRVAKARQEEAKLAFRHALLDAGAEVDNAIAGCKAARERIEIDTRQRDALAQAVGKIELMMRYSTSNYLEVLTAQQSLLDAELGLIGDGYALISSYISLYQALGGGVE